MYKLLFFYNFIGIWVCFFLSFKTTPGHYFYEYSKILYSLKIYQHIPFFWNVVFYSAFVLSFYYLFDSIREFGGFVSTFYAFFDIKSHRTHRVVNLVTRILNSVFCLVCWSFIKYYRSERDKSHDKVLRHQENTEYEYLKKACLKIR